MIGRRTASCWKESAANPGRCAGRGLRVEVPMSTFYNLPELGARVALHTHLVVREDGHFLYSFLTEPERAAFRQLIKISGVGPRIALAVLSGLSVHP